MSMRTLIPHFQTQVPDRDFLHPLSFSLYFRKAPKSRVSLSLVVPWDAKMGKEKLILICQSGGDFMTKDDGSLSYVGGEANAVEISCETQFDDLKLKLAEMCDLEYGSLSLKYFLPQNRRTLISLANDRDLKRMYDFHGPSVTADIFVTGKKGFVSPATSHSPTGKSVIKQAQTVAVPAEVHQDTSPAPSTVASPPRKAATGSVSGSKRKTPSKRKSPRKSVAKKATEDPPTGPSEPIEIDLSATPADTVKKRRRAAFLKNSANVRALLTNYDDDDDDNDDDDNDDDTDDDDDDDGGGGGDDEVEEENEERAIAPLKRKGGRRFKFLSDSAEGEAGDAPMDETIASWKDAIIGEGQEFQSVVEFRDTLQKYAVANRFGYRLRKNETYRAGGKCNIEGCSWKITAAWVPTTEKFTIKKFISEHSCGGKSWKAAHPARSWLVSVIKERLRDNPNHTPKDIANSIFKDFGLELNYSQARRGIEDAREQLQGSYKDAYSQLPWFCEKLVELNPGSVAKFCTGDDDRFQRLFISFQPSIQGFENGCRPLLFLDATYLKSKYHEILLTASTLDGDDAIFPVAFAVVDVENDENWRWFLEELKSALATSNPITFVSDMEKGLKTPVVEVFENAHHGYSIFHLLESFNKDMKGPFLGDGRSALPSLFVAAAHSFTIDAFTRHTEQIKRISYRTHDWVIQTQPENWASAYFKGERYNYITFDVAETYGRWIDGVRELPILHKVQSLCSKLIELFNSRREISSEWSFKLVPSYEIKVHEASSKATRMRVLFSSDTLVEVHGDDSHSTHVVDLNKHECTCQVWRMTGFPCSHAIAVFNCTGRTPYDYYPKCYSVELYRATYLGTINPVPIRGNSGGGEESGSSEEDQSRQILPPSGQKPPGLLNKRRPRVTPGKIKMREMTCSRCHGVGHNKASCKGPLPLEEVERFSYKEVPLPLPLRLEEAETPSCKEPPLQLEGAAETSPCKEEETAKEGVEETAKEPVEETETLARKEEEAVEEETV